MGIKPIFDKDKAVECVLYLAEKEPNTYELLKLLYFAEKIHLEKYGRLITGDTYVAMNSGPVPSSCYDIIKFTKGYRGRKTGRENHGFVMDYYRVLPERSCDLEELSESEVECLEESWKLYGNLPPSVKKRKSHDEAYEEARQKRPNSTMPIESIAKTIPNSQDLLKHLGF